MSFPVVAPLEPEAWEHRAACREHDATLFFGPNRFEPKRERLAREAMAKEVCRHCSVRGLCRDYAVEFGESFGVWGGLSETERREQDLGKAGAA